MITAITASADRSRGDPRRRRDHGSHSLTDCYHWWVASSGCVPTPWSWPSPGPDEGNEVDRANCRKIVNRNEPTEGKVHYWSHHSKTRLEWLFDAAHLASLIGESGEGGLVDLGDRGDVSGAVGVGRRQLHWLTRELRVKVPRVRLRHHLRLERWLDLHN